MLSKFTNDMKLRAMKNTLCNRIKSKKISTSYNKPALKDDI